MVGGSLFQNKYNEMEDFFDVNTRDYNTCDRNNKMEKKDGRIKDVDVKLLKGYAEQTTASLKSIANEMKIDVKTVKRKLKRNNIVLAKNKLPSESDLYDVCLTTTLSEIARKCKIEPESFEKKLKYRGISWRTLQRKKLNECKPMILEMIKNGSTLSEISSRFGWKRKYVSHRLKKLGIDAKVSTRWKKHTPKLIPIKNNLNYEGNLWMCKACGCDYYLENNNDRIIIEEKEGGFMEYAVLTGIAQLVYAEEIFNKYLKKQPNKKWLIINKKINVPQTQRSRFGFIKFLAEKHNVEIMEKNLIKS